MEEDDVINTNITDTYQFAGRVSVAINAETQASINQVLDMNDKLKDKVAHIAEAGLDLYTKRGSIASAQQTGRLSVYA